MPATATLSAEDRDVLRHFVKTVDSMSRSRFIETYRRQDQRISFKASAEPQITAPSYDWEDFVAFLTLFRQVAISKNEPIYLFKITNVARQYAHEDFSQKLDELESTLKPILDGTRRCFHVGRDAEGPEPEMQLSTFEVLDAIVNGKVFHADKKQRPRVAFLDTLERWQYLWPVMIELVKPALKGSIWLFHALRHFGVLPETDYPAKSPADKKTANGSAGTLAS